MIRNIRRRIATCVTAFATCTLLVGASHAGTIATVGPVTITNIVLYTGASGTQAALVTFTPATANLAGCSFAAGNVAWIDFSSTIAPTGTSLYATVLSAYLSGQTIGFGFSGCVDAGVYPLVNQIAIPHL
jgi:hypothetical protein